jgi:hypothetical protein
MFLPACTYRHTICAFTAVGACCMYVYSDCCTWDYTAILHLQLKGTAIMNRKHKTVGEVVLLTQVPLLTSAAPVCSETTCQVSHRSCLS